MVSTGKKKREKKEKRGKKNGSTVKTYFQIYRLQIYFFSVLMWKK